MNLFMWLAKTQPARKQWWERNGDLVWAVKWLSVYAVLLAGACVIWWNILIGWQQDKDACAKVTQEYDALKSSLTLSNPLPTVDLKPKPRRIKVCKNGKCRMKWERVKP